MHNRGLALLAGIGLLVLGGSAAAQAPLPYSETFEAGLPADWSTTATSGTVVWDVDATPAGAPFPDGPTFGGSSASLNYNDGTWFDDGFTNSGTATSEEIDTSTATGTVEITFQCNYETEDTDTIFDVRTLEVLDGTTLAILASYTFGETGSSAPPATTCSPMGTYHLHTITAGIGAAGSIRLRFGFDTGDDIANDFAGWFIDDLTVDVGPPPPPALPLPYSETFDAGSIPADWAITGTSGTVAWDVDALPTPVGPGPDGATFGGSAGSLNYNDDFTFDDGATNSGTATSPVLDTSASGGSIDISFQCNYETETSDIFYDIRTLEVVDASTLSVIASYTFAETGDSDPPSTTCAAMGTYHLHTITVAVGAAASVRLRFGFDTGDAIANAFSGWFVDDLSVTGGCVDTTAPPAPTNVLPADGDSLASPVFLDWTDVADTSPCGPGGVDFYVVQVDDDPVFGSIDFTSSPVVSNATTGALAVGTYYWRARAVDLAGNLGPFSISTTFIVCADVTAPAAPTNVTPADGALLPGPATVFLDWTDAVDTSSCGPGSVASYVVEVDDDPGFGSLAFTGSPAISEATTGVLPLGTYYWRARAVDGAGNVGANSIVTSFVICADTTPPPAPSNVTPADAALIPGPAAVTLDWTDVADTSTCGAGGLGFYVVEVDDDPGFGSLTFTSSPAVSTATTGVLPLGTYYWRARAVDAAGNVGANSAVTSFVICTDTTPPPAPVKVSPTDGATIPPPSTIFLDWADVVDTSTCGPGGLDYYQVEVDDDPGFGSLNYASSPAVSNATTGALALGTYSWRVRAVDLAGNIGPWTPVTTFVVCTDTTAPSVPVNVAPLDGEFVPVPPPGVPLDWSDSVDSATCGPSSVASYIVEVDDDPAFGSIDFTDTPVASNSTTGLLPDGTYYWRVRAVDTNGNWSANSVVTFFVIEGPWVPSAPDTLFVNESNPGAQSGRSGYVDPVVDLDPNFSAIYRDPNTTDFAASLRLQVSTDPTFATVDYDSGIVPLAIPLAKNERCPDQTLTTELRRDTVYYWRIQFTDAAGLTGPFSAAQSFHTGDDFQFGVRRGSSNHSRRCFVATAAWGAGSVQVGQFTGFRSSVLDLTPAGRMFCHSYAAFGPAAARHLPPSATRGILGPLAHAADAPVATGAACLATLLLLLFVLSRRL